METEDTMGFQVFVDALRNWERQAMATKTSALDVECENGWMEELQRKEISQPYLDES